MLRRPEKIYEPETCAWCSGGGKTYVAPGHMSSCKVCGGKGNIKIAQPSSACKHCEGTGRRNPTNACIVCAGTGWQHSPLQSA